MVELVQALAVPPVAWCVCVFFVCCTIAYAVHKNS